MTAAIKKDGEYIQSYMLLSPLGIKIKMGPKPKFYENAEDVRQLILNFSVSKLLSLELEPKKEDMSKGNNNKVLKQIKAARGLEERLKTEGETDPLDIEKISRMRRELELLCNKIAKKNGELRR